MAKKQDYIDALMSLGVPEEQFHNLTMHDMGELLKELRENKEKEKESKRPKFKTLEITRSYSRKVNLGNYESEDYFCSRKAEVTENDDLNAVSNFLAYDCKIDVQKQIKSNQSKPF
jgi:hypothetical protein